MADPKGFGVIFSIGDPVSLPASRRFSKVGSLVRAPMQ